MKVMMDVKADVPRLRAILRDRNDESFAIDPETCSDRELVTWFVADVLDSSGSAWGWDPGTVGELIETAVPVPAPDLAIDFEIGTDDDTWENVVGHLATWNYVIGIMRDGETTDYVAVGGYGSEIEVVPYVEDREDGRTFDPEAEPETVDLAGDDVERLVIW